MIKLTARQKLIVMRTSAERYSTAEIKAMSRAEYNAVMEAIALELYSK